MVRALVTRPEPDAESIARALRQRGFEVVVEPLMTVESRDGTLDLVGVQALLVTSRNGARALAGATPRRDIPVLAVGDSTAALARELGFSAVESAGGAAPDLAWLAAARLDPGAGPLVHAAGRHGGGELSRLLAENGFAVRREVLYEAVPVRELSGGLRGQLDRGQIDMALFYSPRTAAIFVALMVEAGLAPAARSLFGICLSPAVARALSPLAFRRVAVAERPDQDALLEAIDLLELGEHRRGRSA